MLCFFLISSRSLKTIKDKNFVETIYEILIILFLKNSEKFNEEYLYNIISKFFVLDVICIKQLIFLPCIPKFFYITNATVKINQKAFVAWSLPMRGIEFKRLMFFIYLYQFRKSIKDNGKKSTSR